MLHAVRKGRVLTYLNHSCTPSEIHRVHITQLLNRQEERARRKPVTFSDNETNTALLATHTSKLTVLGIALCSTVHSNSESGIRRSKSLWLPTWRATRRWTWSNSHPHTPINSSNSHLQWWYWVSRRWLLRSANTLRSSRASTAGLKSGPELRGPWARTVGSGPLFSGMVNGCIF